MGTGNSTRRSSFDANGEVNFDHFQILRAIGKGSFGKVCIVQKKDTKQMFAMKYMNKAMCARQSAIHNVVRELEMLTRLDHPFLVNLWYAFQDEEDLFMVVDLFLGGDLRYHMQQEVSFKEDCVKFYLCELALVLDYLRRQKIIHRDIKPDNILLDEQGHLHVTDFNIATQLKDDELATSMSGTRPYMAPEVYGVAIQERRGYGFPVDWWSLGVSLYELLKKRRPFVVQNSDSLHEMWATMAATKGQPLHLHNVSDGLKDILRLLLEFEPKDRLCSLAQLKEHSYVADMDFEALLQRQISPPFIPSKEQLNCDPTYELEEMIIETKPLHKKKKRLAKQNSRQNSEVMQALCCHVCGCADTAVHDKEDTELQKLTKQFRYYNREQQNKSERGPRPEPSSPTNIKASPITLEAACSNSMLNENYSHHQQLQEGPILMLAASARALLEPAAAVMFEDSARHSVLSSPQEVHLLTTVPADKLDSQPPAPNILSCTDTTSTDSADHQRKVQMEGELHT